MARAANYNPPGLSSLFGSAVVFVMEAKSWSNYHATAGCRPKSWSNYHATINVAMQL